MSGAFTRVYSDEQREAVGRAFVEERWPAARVAELAAAGELTGPDGTKLPPFHGRDGEAMGASSVRSIARDFRKRRAGRRPETSVSLASAPARDAIEVLRRELVTAAERGLAAIRRYQDSHDGKIESWEDLRQATRCVREAAALPGPTDPRPLAPGQKDGGRLPGDSATRGGVAGALLLAHRTTGVAPVAPGPPAPRPSPAMPDRASSEPEPEPEPDLSDPGVFAAELARRIDAGPAAPQAGGNAPTASPLHGPARGPQRRDRDEVPRRGMPDEDTAAIDGMPRRRRAR